MALRLIHSLDQRLKIDNRLATQYRWLAKKRSKKNIRTAKKEKCSDKTCKKRKGFWNFLLGRSGYKEKPQVLQTAEACQKRFDKQLNSPDPDLSCFGGVAYRTCGEAYVIQKQQSEMKMEKSQEDEMIRKIELSPELKEMEDPMPTFTSSSQRLIDLSEKKLHPLYKNYMFTTKKPKPVMPQFQYKTRSGPISLDDIPKTLKINKALLEKKNLFADFKKIEPPRYLLGPLIEMKKNEKPTLDPNCQKDDQ